MENNSFLYETNGQAMRYTYHLLADSNTVVHNFLNDNLNTNFDALEGMDNLTHCADLENLNLVRPVHRNVDSHHVSRHIWKSHKIRYISTIKNPPDTSMLILNLDSHSLQCNAPIGYDFFLL